MSHNFSGAVVRVQLFEKVPLLLAVKDIGRERFLRSLKSLCAELGLDGRYISSAASIIKRTKSG